MAPYSLRFEHEGTDNLISSGTWVPVRHRQESGWTCCDSTNVTANTYSFNFKQTITNPCTYSEETINNYVDMAIRAVNNRFTASLAVDWTPAFQAPSEEFLEARRKRRLRETLRNNSFPGILIKPKRTPLPTLADDREQRARETLRRVIGEQKWKNFLKHGFISIRAQSGRVYQIFPSHKFTKVFDKGVLVERLCVVMTGNFPPTDSLIMRYLLILNNEEDFWNRAIKHGAPIPRPTLLSA